MKYMRCCLNPKVIAGLALLAVGLLAISPRLLGSALPVLLGLICPLSMIGMVIGMSRQRRSDRPSDAETRHVEIRALRDEVRVLRDRQRTPIRTPSDIA